MTNKHVTAFSRLIRMSRESRSWSVAELARRAGLTQPEVSRVESGARKPTLRHVKGLAEAFAAAPSGKATEPQKYADWLVQLVDTGERARISERMERLGRIAQ
jgi:transcriptional regulator with XRE-family HTH domain